MVEDTILLVVGI